MLYNHDVTVYGEALETFGLTVSGAINGIGLVSFGFLWECPEIWSTVSDNPTTSWTTPTVPSTSWSTVSDNPTTTWVDSTNPSDGEC